MLISSLDRCSMSNYFLPMRPAGNQLLSAGFLSILFDVEYYKETIMSTISSTTIDLQAQRSELHDALNLTGAEISVNNLPAGVAVPFVHSHKNNEEIYMVLQGRGEAWVDGTVHELHAGSCLKIGTGAARAIRAAEDSALSFVCVQVKEGSLEGYTMSDAELVKPENGPSWLA